MKRGSVFFAIFEARKFFSLAYYLLEPSRCETCRLLCYICCVYKLFFFSYIMCTSHGSLRNVSWLFFHYLCRVKKVFLYIVILLIAVARCEAYRGFLLYLHCH